MIRALRYLLRLVHAYRYRRWSPSVEIDRSGRWTPLDQLSPRQVQVLRLLAAGRSVDEAGMDLGIASDTVKNYVSSIYLTLDVHCREEAYAAVGWLVVPEEEA